MPYGYWNLHAIWDHSSVTCHLAEVTFPPLPQPLKAGTRCECFIADLHNSDRGSKSFLRKINYARFALARTDSIRSVSGSLLSQSPYRRSSSVPVFALESGVWLFCLFTSVWRDSCLRGCDIPSSYTQWIQKCCTGWCECYVTFSGLMSLVGWQKDLLTPASFLKVLFR